MRVRWQAGKVLAIFFSVVFELSRKGRRGRAQSVRTLWSEDMMLKAEGPTAKTLRLSSAGSSSGF